MMRGSLNVTTSAVLLRDLYVMVTMTARIIQMKRTAVSKEWKKFLIFETKLWYFIYGFTPGCFQDF